MSHVTGDLEQSDKLYITIPDSDNAEKIICNSSKNISLTPVQHSDRNHNQVRKREERLFRDQTAADTDPTLEMQSDTVRGEDQR